MLELETDDILDRALLRAKHAKQAGTLPAPEYYRLQSRVDSLKKLAFVEEYERGQDQETYEFMKYKVAAEVGGPEEKEAFRLYEKQRI